MARALVLFAVAGLAEICGGWLIWQWLREGRPWPWGLVGAVGIVLYGVIPTLQADPQFGRFYAAYGGVFIVQSLVWGRLIDGFEVDRWDILGSAICLICVLVIYFDPRGRSLGAPDARCIEAGPTVDAANRSSASPSMARTQRASGRQSDGHPPRLDAGAGTTRPQRLGSIASTWPRGSFLIHPS